MRNRKDVYNFVTVPHLPVQESKDEFYLHDTHFCRSNRDRDPQISCVRFNSFQTDFRTTLQGEATLLKVRNVTILNDTLLLCIPKNSFQDCSRQTNDWEKNDPDYSVECMHVPARKGHLDGLLKCISNETVTEWLEQASSVLDELKTWCCSGYNFVRFANFWLHEIPHNQKVNLLQLEVGILKDELEFACRDIVNKQCHQSDSYSILEIALPEYPEKLLPDGEQYLFLDYLSLMSSDKVGAYKMMSDVKYSNISPQLVLCVLAMWAFALTSIWHAVVKFCEVQTSNQPYSKQRTSSSVIGSPKKI